MHNVRSIGVSRRALLQPMAAAAVFLPAAREATVWRTRDTGRVVAGFDAATLARARAETATAALSVRGPREGLDPGYLRRLTTVWAHEWDWSAINRALSKLDLRRIDLVATSPAVGESCVHPTLPAARIVDVLEAQTASKTATVSAAFSERHTYPVERGPVDVLVGHLTEHNAQLATGRGRQFRWDELLLDATVDWLWPAIRVS